MVKAEDVRLLREKTGAGMMKCKKALSECRGDMEKAVDYLRKKGLADAANKQGRVASEGRIDSYIHDGRIGVMVEVNCETDFVAKNDDFQDFVKNISMHIAAADPKFVCSEEMDSEFVERERQIYTAQLRGQGKPEGMIAKIVEGKIKKLETEVCLLNQKFVRNPDITINDLVNDLVLKLGEKIHIRRFVRFNLGEGIQKKRDNITSEVAKMTKKQ